MPRIPFAAPSALILLLALPGLLRAQDEDRLATEAEVGASLFFGNTDQTTVTTRTSVEWKGAPWALRGAANFSYGEAADETGSTFVNKRSWALDAAADYTAFGRLSPSITGRVESSFEKRVDLRVAGGGGATVRALDTERTQVALGMAVLAEHTRPASDAGLEAETVGRWSARAQLRRMLGDGKVTLSSDTGYNPELTAFDSFTVTSENSLAFALTDMLSLKLSFLDSYDSEAESRGAETNNDGQLVFSLLASF